MIVSQPQGFEDKVSFVWKVADKLRGHFKPHAYGSVMLPLLVLRRLDAVLEPSKAEVGRAGGLVCMPPAIGPGPRFYRGPLTAVARQAVVGQPHLQLSGQRSRCGGPGVGGASLGAPTGQRQPAAG